MVGAGVSFESQTGRSLGDSYAGSAISVGATLKSWGEFPVQGAFNY